MTLPRTMLEQVEARMDSERPHDEVQGSLAPLMANDTRVAGRLVSAPPVREFVLDGLLPKGIVGAVVAAGGKGKSFLLLQLAYVLASGCSLGPLRAAKPISTLLLAGEDDQGELDRRLWPLRSFPNGLHVASVAGKIGPLMYLDGSRPMHSEWYSWLDKTIGGHTGLGVLILDPKSRFYGLEENNNDHATQWIACLEALAIEHSLTILFAHHVAKSQSDSLTQAMSRGASALIDGCRWAAGLVEPSAEMARTFAIANPRQYVVLDVVKNNYAPALPAPIFFKRGPSGLLEHAALAKDRLEAMAKCLCESLADQPEKLTRRELVSQAQGKPVADAMQGVLAGFVRSRDMSPAIDFALQQGLLIEAPGQPTGKRPRTELHVAGVGNAD